MSNCTYAILPIAEIENINYAECNLNGIYNSSVVVKNVAETEFMVKWCGGTKPQSLQDIETANSTTYTTYDNAGILTELAKVEWTPEMV